MCAASWPRSRLTNVCLAIIYACGLRLQEGLQLHVSQIDSARMVLHIRAGKGNKDRDVPLPASALQVLRVHWRTHRHRSGCFLHAGPAKPIPRRRRIAP
nr:tyrosine-type recombinase/integrase [Herpetosiphon giganteus]